MSTTGYEADDDASNDFKAYQEPLTTEAQELLSLYKKWNASKDFKAGLNFNWPKWFASKHFHWMHTSKAHGDSTTKIARRS